MDHIPGASRISRALSTIVYVPGGRYAYDHNGLADFPSRVGVDTNKLAYGDCDIQDAYCFMQQWLFFGVIVEIFKAVGIEVALTDLVRIDDSGQMVLSTFLLPYYIGIWERKVETNPDASKEHKSVVLSTLRVSKAFLDKVLARDRLAAETILSIARKSGQDGQLESLFVCISVLFESLSHAAKILYGNPIGTVDQTRLVDKYLLDAGWCPNEVDLLGNQESSGQNTELVFLGSMDRRRLRKDHSRCLENPFSSEFQAKPAAWQVNYCQGDQLDVKTYETQHTDSCDSTCEFVLSLNTVAEVETVVAQGKTPVLSIQDRSSYRTASSARVRSAEKHRSIWEYICGIYRMIKYALQNRMVQCRIEACLLVQRSPIRYVAFSHVWSDGLGNPRANSLPPCQFLRLQSLANQSSAGTDISSPFWIDTICVPLAEPYRNAAIMGMVNVYGNASTVVVLDRSLLLESMRCPPDESLMKIKHSTWAKRLWTLHEAMLAKSLEFQFSDGIATAEELFTCYFLLNDEDSSLTQPIAHSFVLANAEKFGIEEFPVAKMWPKGPPEPSNILTSQWKSAANSEDQELITRLEQGIQKALPLETYMEWPVPVRPYRCGGFLNSSLAVFRNFRDRESIANAKTVKLLLDAVRWRTTSRVEDEAICLANIIGSDMSWLLALPRDQRMSRLIQTFKEFPVDIIFGNKPRMEAYGMRWMPLSFLKCGWENKATSSILGVSTPTGLLVSLPAMLLSPLDNRADQKHVYFQAPDTRYVALIRDRDDKSWEDYRDARIALLFADHPGNRSDLNAFSAVLVTLLREEDGISYTRLEANVVYGPADPSAAEQPAWGHATFVQEPRQWCIG